METTIQTVSREAILDALKSGKINSNDAKEVIRLFEESEIKRLESERDALNIKIKELRGVAGKKGTRKPASPEGRLNVAIGQHLKNYKLAEKAKNAVKMKGFADKLNATEKGKIKLAEYLAGKKGSAKGQPAAAAA